MEEKKARRFIDHSIIYVSKCIYYPAGFELAAGWNLFRAGAANKMRAKIDGF